MKINKIYIKNFGKLKDFHLDFNENFNIIFGENEGGKTTVMSFVKMMFYGTPRGSGDLLKNPRKRYAPWNGEGYGGVIEFSKGGVSYSLERQFGGTNSTDKISLWDLGQGVVIPITADTVGEQIFGINLDSFEKSVFIGQIGALTGVSSQDELSLKLSNLVSSGDESVSFTAVASRLTQAKTKLRGKRGGGIIDKLESQRGELFEELRDAETLEEEKKQASRQLVQLKKSLDIITIECNAISRQLEQQTRLKSFNKMKVLLDSYNEVQSLEKQLAEKKARLRGLDRKALSKCQELYVQLNGLKQQILHQQKEQQRLLQTISQETEGESRITSAMIKEMQGEEKRISQLQHTIDSEKQDILSNAKGTVMSLESVYQFSVDNVERIRKSLDDSIRRDGLSTTRTVETEKVNLLGLGFFVLFAIASIITGVMISPVFYSGLLISGLGIGALILNNRWKKKTIEALNVGGDTQQTQDLQNDLERAEAEMNLNKHNLDREREHLEVLTQHSAEKTQKLSEEKLQIETALKEKLDKFKCGSIDELIHLYGEQKSQLSGKQAIIHNAAQVENRLKQELLEKQGEIIKFISLFAPVKTIQEGEVVLVKLEELLEEYIAFSNKVAHKKTTVEKEMDGLTLEMLVSQMEKASSVISQGNIALLKEEEIAQLEREFKGKSEEKNQLGLSINQVETSLRLKYSDKKEISSIQNEIDGIKEEILQLDNYYNSIVVAEENLEKAEQELRSSFGPILDRKASEIFEKITHGKYNKLMVSKTFEINVQETGDSFIREWKSLSGGTIDQAYLALRLALSELLRSDVGNLAVLIDDVFIQYDDKRAGEGIRFLQEYSKEHQILFFTCHQRIVDIAKGENVSNILKI